MSTKEKIWLSAYCAGIADGQSMVDCKLIARQAIADFETDFPEQSEPVGDFIKIPRKDKSGFDLPEWAKPGAEVKDLYGKKVTIDFIGIDKLGRWCAYYGPDEKRNCDFIAEIKPISDEIATR